MAVVKRPVVKPRVPAAVKFLRDATAPGTFGTVIAIDPTRDADNTVGRAYTSDSIEDIAAFIADHERQHHNLYWSPNPTQAPSDKKPKKADIAAMHWVHLDLDDPSPEARARVQAYRLPPSMIVMSGGGFNVYWRLTEPIHANGNIDELEDANRRVILDLGADKGTQNLDRILRLPGTINYPSKTKLARGRVPVAATLVEINLERTYSLKDFPRLTEQERRDWGKSGKTATAALKSTDRSRDLMAKVSRAVREGASDADIHAALDDHPHAADQSDAARAVDRCIEKARSEQTGIIATINAENALIWVNGKLVVMWPQLFENGLPRLSTAADVRLYWRTHQRGKINPVDLWLGSASRREFSGFCFRPGAGETGDKFNLFRGWGVESDPNGDCSLFLAHLRDVICNGDAQMYLYVIQWLANSVQTPENKPGTCLAIRSGQGSGKGAVARYLAPIYGSHLARLSGPDQLLGRFNDTLAGKLMVFGDEAAWPRDRRGTDKLKAFISEERITVERKHVPAVEIDNHTRFIFATNHEHSAPAEIDDRRFVALNASDARAGDQAYWDALETERENGGPAAFLHYLLNVKLTLNLRSTPKTAALAEQKLMSLDDIGGFARELMLRERHRLDKGFNVETGGYRFTEIEFGEITTTAVLHEFYLDYCRRNGIAYRKSIDGLGIGLRKYLTLTKREARTEERKRLGLGKRAQVYEMPSLAVARKQFENALKQPVEWPDSRTSTGKGVGTGEGTGERNA